MKQKQNNQNWEELELGKILNYEQPTKYIVEDTDYDDDYETPVLTAGKSFLLGYTNETEGIYQNLPVIIFDDFTTANKFVDFKFKVKSSAMKLLTIADDNVDLKYVYLMMQCLSLSHGMHKRYYLSKYQYEKIPLPILPDGTPDLEKQKQIVAILEKAEGLKDRGKGLDELFDEYLKSVFGEMFLKEDFEKSVIKDIGKVISGATPKTCNPDYWDGEINWIAPAELSSGHNYYYYNTKKKITSEGYKSCSAELFPKGTVMLSSRAPIGKVAIAGGKMCSNQGFKNILLSDDVNSVYLYYWLFLKKEYLNSLGRGATFKEISKKIVENIKIPVPPITLQEKFASIVEQVEKIKDKLKNEKKDADELFDALMQKAFSGELV